MDQALRAECPAPALPADPVTPSAALQFSHEQGIHAACLKVERDGLLATIDAHNAAARQ